MTRVLKRPANAASSLRLPVRTHDARGQARAQLQEAPREPEPTVDAAALKAELDALREQAVREGLAQGQAQAEREIRAALEAELKQWRSGLEAIEAAVAKKLQAIEPLAAAVGFEAFAVTLGEAYRNHEALVASVRRLADEAASTTLTVHVAPAQLERVRAALADAGATTRMRLQFEADTTLSATDCRVVSDRGQWETGLARQLQVIQDACLRGAEADAAKGQS